MLQADHVHITVSEKETKCLKESAIYQINLMEVYDYNFVHAI